MKYRISMEVLCESEKPDLFEHLALEEEPWIEFDRLDDAVAFLNRIADATDDPAVREYAGRVRLEGEAAEKAVRRWGNRKTVTLEGEVKKAITAAAAVQQTAKK